MRQVAEDYTLTNGVAQRRVEQLTKDIETKLNMLEIDMLSGHSEAFLEAMTWWSKFHRYSFNNTLLIKMQAPQTEAVAGYKQWQAQGFQVRKGAVACWIRAPWIKRLTDQDTCEIEPRLIGYYPVAVFPIEQTIEYQEGKRPPEPMIPATGADWLHLYECWTRRLQTLYGIDVGEHRLGKIYGLCSPNRIRINAKLEIAQKASTLVHEVCHLAAHHHQDRTLDLRQRELEAEASCAVVCSLLGAEHPAAVDYLINYRIQPDELKKNMEKISQIVKDVKAMLAIDTFMAKEETAAVPDTVAA